MKCSMKSAYKSKANAALVAERVLSQRGVQLQTYQCPQCRKWHLTHWKDESDPWALLPEEIVRTWRKIGLLAVLTCVERGTISKSNLSKAIRLIEEDPTIPDLWKLAELGLLRELWLKMNS